MIIVIDWSRLSFKLKFTEEKKKDKFDDPAALHDLYCLVASADDPPDQLSASGGGGGGGVGGGGGGGSHDTHGLTRAGHVWENSNNIWNFNEIQEKGLV